MRCVERMRGTRRTQKGRTREAKLVCAFVHTRTHVHKDGAERRRHRKADIHDHDIL